MAQTNYTPIYLYNSGTATNTPLAANLGAGELAINYTDGKLFYKDNNAAIQVIGWKTTPTTAGGTGLTSYTAGDLPYYASGSALSKLGIGTANYVLTSSGTAPQYVAQATLSVGSATNATNTAITDNTSSSATWYPTIVSATTGNLPQTTSSTKLSFVPSTGTLTATSHAGAWAGNTITVPYGGTGITSLTANYIPYGNGTSAFQSSSNFTFDGSNLSVNGNINCNGNNAISASNPTGGSGGLKLSNPSNNTNAYIARFYGYDGSQTGSIQTYVNLTTYSVSSDKRLKNDIGIATDMSVIDNTIIHDFSWKFDNRVDRGVFAQEAYLVKPIAVVVGEDTLTESGSLAVPWSVDYSKYIPDLIVYCQQLKKQITTMQAQLKAAGVAGF